jgi:glucose/arabinose dehydrogenase
MRRLTGLMLAAALVSSLAACDDDDKTDPNSQIGANPTLPAIRQYLFPPMHVAKVTGWKDGETPSVPEGFKIEALASGLHHPRNLYVLPNGDILVSESKAPYPQPIKRPKDLVMGWIEKLATSAGDAGPGNRLSILRENPNGHGTSVDMVFLDHLNSPFGVALVGDDLYVAQSGSILRFPYSEGETRIDAQPTTLTQIPGGPIDHHWTKSLLASRDGTLLYVGVGSNSNITENGMDAEMNRAAILEVDRASGRSRIFASGLRNPNAMSWEPESGAMWTVVNERDEIGPNLVPDYLTSVKEGAFYGWPYSYYGQHLDPRVKPQRPDLVAAAIPPDYALSSHVAPLGLAFAKDSSLPEKYRAGAFVGEHGSWNRIQLNGYKVVFIPFGGGKPAGKAEDVVTGFISPDGKARGRPVGLAFDKTGALLIADDVGNTIWRVSAAP